MRSFLECWEVFGDLLALLKLEQKNVFCPNRNILITLFIQKKTCNSIVKAAGPIYRQVPKTIASSHLYSCKLN